MFTGVNAKHWYHCSRSHLAQTGTRPVLAPSLFHQERGFEDARPDPESVHITGSFLKRARLGSLEGWSSTAGVVLSENDYD